MNTKFRGGTKDCMEEYRSASRHMGVTKNSIRDARTPQPGKIVFNTMRYRGGSETVHRLGYFQSSVSVQIMFK